MALNLIMDIQTFNLQKGHYIYFIEVLEEG